MGLGGGKTGGVGWEGDRREVRDWRSHGVRSMTRRATGVRQRAPSMRRMRDNAMKQARRQRKKAGE